jgi:hypothetical protein
MEFLIYQVKSADDSYQVAGIYDGKQPIEVGSQFLKIYKVIPRTNSEGNCELTGKELIQDVKLVVNEIKAYGHSLDELYSGMSAELSLIGDEGIILTKDNILGG